MAKHRYKTTNFKHYNQALINSGSLTFWIDEEAIRIKQAVPLIPIREGATFWERAHPRNLAVGMVQNQHWEKKYNITSVHSQKRRCSV